MATVTDYLDTVLRLVGGQSYSAQLNQAAASADKLAKAQKDAEAAADRNAQAMRRGANALAANALGTLAGVLAVREFVNATETAEDATFRTTVLLRNLGNSFPIERAQTMAEALAQTTSASRSQIIQMVGLAKQYGVADNQVQNFSKTMLDFAKGNPKGTSLEAVTNASLRAIAGNPMLLNRMGVHFVDLGDKIKNTTELMRTLNNLFGGAAEAQRNTLTGAFEHLKSSFENFASSMTGLIPVLNKVADALDKASGHPSVSTGISGAITGALIGKNFGWQGALIGAAIGALGGALAGAIAGKNPNAAAAIGNGKSQLATEETLEEIAANTKTMSDAFVKAVLGGPGTVARSAFTSRDARIAFGV